MVQIYYYNITQQNQLRMITYRLDFLLQLRRKEKTTFAISKNYVMKHSLVEYED